MRKSVGFIPASVFMTIGCFCGYAQNPVAVKTNVLYDAFANANLGAEVRLDSRWSLDLSADYNGWKLSHGRQWKHWLLQPEVRWWTAESMRGHFLAAHLLGGEFNTTLRGARRQGWGIGAGVGYGYSWRFHSNWGLEGEIAVGYVRYSYDKYPCSQCGRKIASRSRDYAGPTKAAVNLVYYFGGTPKPVVPEIVVPVEVPEIPAPVAVDTVPRFRFLLVDVPHSRVRSENISGTARVGFAVNKTAIDPALGGNAAELWSIISKLDSVRDDLDMQIVSVELTGYASPEGSYANNGRLASGRTAALMEYIRSERNLPDSVITVRSVPEDWDGLRKGVIAAGYPDSEILLDIIDSDRKPDEKEALLRRRKESWRKIAADILPSLRRTDYRIEYEHRYEEREARTLEEVNRAIDRDDADTAARLLVDIPSSPEADYARGVVAALQKRYDEAEAWFIRARARGVSEADDALRQLEAVTGRK